MTKSIKCAIIGEMKELRSYTYNWLMRNGRLGNQLWQIAWTYGQAKKVNGQACVLPNWEYRKYVNIPDEMYDGPKFRTVDGETNYFQELKWWSHCELEVWTMFQPTQLALKELTRYAKDILQTPESCAIHFRYGDYTKYPDHYPLPSDKYYISAIQNVLEDSPETHFFVFSDDMNLVKKRFNSNPFYLDLVNDNKITLVVGQPRPVEVVDRVGEPLDWRDMYSISLCNRHIISNSTFSWWGAYLSATQHPVMYPSVWYGQHESVKNIPWKNAIPESWKEIQV